MDPSTPARGANLVDTTHATIATHTDSIPASAETFSFSKWLGRQVSWMPSWLTCAPLGALQIVETHCNSHVAPHISWVASHITSLFTTAQKNSPLAVLGEVGAKFNQPDEHSAINQLILDYATPQDVSRKVGRLIQYPLRGNKFIDNKQLRAFEKDIRSLTNNGNAPYREFADCYLNFFSQNTGLHVIKQIDDFMNLEGSWNCVRAADSLLSELLTTILQDKGHTTEEILDHLQASGWFKKAQEFTKIAERNIERVIEENSEAFQKFCKERKHQFSLLYHSPGIHRALKRTGFVHSPRMATPDRMICWHCKVQFSGFRAWYDPQSFHRADITHPAPELLEAQPDVLHTGSDTTFEET